MPGRALRVLLNRLRWDPAEGAGRVALLVRVREEGVERAEEVSFGEIDAILPAGVTLLGGTFLPYHRVLEVRRDQEVLWAARRARGRDDES